ncbi:MAG: flap endonuclease-1 [Candidatus Marsarchaeota archaeon]|nr:flap endonuclease-1 [Candidatus Marsarchaeota archaeon]MCL5418873.1 flap endonuclease-1 [Candidatus Marsarchaeota archaeon]
MAVDLSKLVSKRKLLLDELSGKTIAIDAYNFLYQFLAIIRQPDGTPLTDAHGAVTSHLSGIFFRSIDIIAKGIKPIYVFDGVPSMLKQKTIEARMNRREEAYREWQVAKEAGNVEQARAHAMASTRVTKEIVKSAKDLLDLMGIGYVNAPSEGEAQASYMCRKGFVYATASQDYDTMLFASPVVIRNLTFSGRRKLPNKNVYVNVEPEMVSLEDTLNGLKLTQRQLIWVGILLGTDFNSGIKGIGPKTAIKIVKSVSSMAELKSVVSSKYGQEFDVAPEEVEALFMKPEVKDLSGEEMQKLASKIPNRANLVKFLCDDHGFSRERIEKYAGILEQSETALRQKTITKWF